MSRHNRERRRIRAATKAAKQKREDDVEQRRRKDATELAYAAMINGPVWWEPRSEKS